MIPGGFSSYSDSNNQLIEKSCQTYFCIASVDILMQEKWNLIHEKARTTSHPNPKNWKKWRFHKNGSNEISMENATKKQEDDKKIVIFQ